jgi:LmbE family N-acetylglucosaminyl deacetylase
MDRGPVVAIERGNMRRMVEGERVLVIAPHCDDETYGMGGTILKLRAHGAQVFVCVVVCGDLHFEHTNSIITREERIAEFGDVMRALGCEGTVLGFKQETRMDTVPIADVVSAIERVQNEFQSDCWYMIGPSFHQDHRVVFEAAQAAARPTRRTTPRKIFRYELPTYSGNPREWGFTAHVYEDISDFLDEKIAACAHYKSQIRPEGMLSLDAIRRFAQARGFESRCAAAECFEVVRIIR